MPNLPTRIYWDANVFLEYINGVPAHLPVLQALLDRAGRGEIEIVTSVVSMTEVAFGAAEQLGKALEPDVEVAIDAFWADTAVIKLVEFHQMIAREARDLIRLTRRSGRRLKPLDAIHLATARRLNVAELHTYDDKLFGYASDLGLTIREPATPQPKLMP